MHTTSALPQVVGHRPPPSRFDLRALDLPETKHVRCCGLAGVIQRGHGAERRGSSND